MRFTLGAYRKKAREFQVNWLEVSNILSEITDSGNIDNSHLLENLNIIKQGRKRLEYGVSNTRTTYPFPLPYLIDATDPDWQNDKYIKNGLTKLGRALSKLQYSYQDMLSYERELPKLDIQLDPSIHSAVIITHLK